MIFYLAIPKEALIYSFFVIPAKAGIQQLTAFIALDSGSSLYAVYLRLEPKAGMTVRWTFPKSNLFGVRLYSAISTLPACVI